MFEKFSFLWKGDAPLTDEYKVFDEMLRMDRDLFTRVVDAMRDGSDLKSIEESIYRGDIKINKLERKLRKQIVTHLSLNPGQEVVASLVLMSIVKDAERLGDHCKNLYESAVHWGRPLSELAFASKLSEFILYVTETFEATIKAFDTEDDTLAAEIIQDEVRWNKRFDTMIDELVSSDVSTREAVCTTLFLRTLKRVQAHLSNIASSVVLPVHRLDHRPKHLREKKEK